MPLNFIKTKIKLEDARISLKSLRDANNPVEFRTAFGNFINNARAITYAMQKEGSKYALFKQWYKQKQSEMEKDELLRFVHNARIDDFHKGESVLTFETVVIPQNLNLAIGIAAMYTNKDNKGWNVSIRGDGLSTAINEGTPKEERVMLDQRLVETSISIQNPPKTHLGEKLNSNQPIYLCEQIIKYFEDLVFQATKL